MYFIFFFFKQNTAYDVRISDWSSDVCSSDLPDQAVDGRGTDHAAIGFGADTNAGEAGRDRAAGAGTGTAWAAIEHIRIAGLAATCAPARCRMRGAEVGPFAEVGLAEDHRARCAQTGHQDRKSTRLHSSH